MSATHFLFAASAVKLRGAADSARWEIGAGCWWSVLFFSSFAQINRVLTLIEQHVSSHNAPPVFSMRHECEDCRICLRGVDTHLQYAPPALRLPVSVYFFLFYANYNSHFRTPPAPGTCAESETDDDVHG